MLRMYNTLSRKIEEIQPNNPGHIGMYSCGPTVYQHPHIGNFRSYVFSDLIRRSLEVNGLEVKQVVNITDVGHLTDEDTMGEDKIEREAKIRKMSAKEIARVHESYFRAGLSKLNIELPHAMPRATEHIKEQIDLIKKIEEQGFVYRTSDGMYFNSEKFPNYGALRGQHANQVKAGARISMGEKKHTGDFALWKFSKNNERRQMEWSSPWGIGYPGWHVECSAMSKKYLGLNFDIHTGGIDHIPVHHTNEIAQTVAAMKKPVAKYWFHHEFLLLDTKMSKSEGDVILLEDLENENYSPLDLRYLFLQVHWQQPLRFTFASLKAAREARYKLAEYFRISHKKEEPQQQEKILELINENLHTPKMIAYLWTEIRNNKLAHSSLQFADRILGLRLLETATEKNIIPTGVQKLVAKREEARAEKNWQLSDDIRKEIESCGFSVRDSDEGPQIHSL